MNLPPFIKNLNLFASPSSTHPVLNVSQLEKLLIIKDPQKESIFGVIGRMEVLLDYFKADPRLHGFIPFLTTYYLVTKASADKYVQAKHFFWSLKDYEVLDVYFASLYFKPMFIYLTTKQAVPPWQHYLSYCSSQKNIASLQIMLGINAHINADLYKALVKLRYRHQNDFNLVNQILAEVTPEVIKFLAENRHDLVGLSGIVFKDIVSFEFGETIVRWRQEAWTNAQHTTVGNQESLNENIVDRTEKLAVKLTGDFTHMYHLKDVTMTLKDINSLSVKVRDF